MIAVVKLAARENGRDLGSRMAAAISYRTVFALVPMLVVAISIAGFVLGGNLEAQAAIVEAITDVAGSEFAGVIERFLSTALEAANTAALVGSLLLLWSSSTLFLELQRALNDIFDIPLPDEKRLFIVAIQRFVGVVWTVGIGIMVVAVFGVNAAVQIAGDALSSWLDIAAPSISVLGSLTSAALLALVFALVFQTLTLRKIPWQAAWVGGGFTAIAFTLAGLATGAYFNLLGTPTALGISSSIVVLLFLAYVLSSVFLFGAQIARSYWILVYESDRNHLMFSPGPEPEGESAGTGSLALTALATFLIGLFVGRKRNS